MLVGKTFVQRAINGESPYAAIEDADGKSGNFGFRISDFGFQVSSRLRILNPKFEFRNPKFKDWWRRRELNSDPGEAAERLYMLSRFSFLADKRPDFRFTPSK